MVNKILNQAFIDASAYGPGGTTNDSVALQAAIDAAGTAGGGTVICPAPTYNIATPLNLNKNFVRVCGLHAGATAFVGKGSNDVFNVTASRCGIADMSITTANGSIRTAGNGIHLNGSVEAILDNIIISNMFLGINCDSDIDSRLDNCKVYNCYGQALIKVKGTSGAPQSAGVFSRLKLDNTYPGLQTPSTITAWASGTAYTTGVLVNGLADATVVLQCTGAGNSGTTAPTAAAFGTNITDGTVTWQLAYMNNLVGMLFDSYSNVNFIEYVDISGAQYQGISITDSAGLGATSNPAGVFIQIATVDRCVNHCLNITGGQQIIAEKARLTNPITSTVDGVFIGPSVVGPVIISNSPAILGMKGNGIEISSGPKNVGVYNNFIAANNTIGVKVLAGATDFSIQGNFITPNVTGASTVGVSVATGGSDFYIIAGNLVHANTTKVSDGGTGVNKAVVNNI